MSRDYPRADRIRGGKSGSGGGRGSRQFASWLLEQRVSLTIEGIVRELYDVAVPPGVQMPSAVSFKTEEIRRTITIA